MQNKAFQNYTVKFLFEESIAKKKGNQTPNPQASI